MCVYVLLLYSEFGGRCRLLAEAVRTVTLVWWYGMVM